MEAEATFKKSHLGEEYWHDLVEDKAFQSRHLLEEKVA